MEDMRTDGPRNKLTHNEVFNGKIFEFMASIII